MFKPGVSPDGSPIRLWQHGTFVCFCTKHEFLYKSPMQIVSFCGPDGGDILDRRRDRVTHVSTGNVALFAHGALFVVQLSPRKLGRLQQCQHNC